MKRLFAIALPLVLGAAAAVWFWPQGSKPRVLVLGIDSADWDIVDRLIQAGRMPHLKSLKERGVSGPLQTLTDIALSPVIWTSIATGRVPKDHGITWFLVDTKDGQRVPVRSHNRKVRAIWNILAEQDLKPGVVGWWASAPAEPVGAGVIASDALGYHGFGRTGEGMADEQKVYPKDRFAELAPLLPPLQQIDYEYGKRFFHLDADEFYRRSFAPGKGPRPNPSNPIHLFQEYTSTTLGYTAIARKLLAEQDFDLFMVYYEGVDSISHLFMKYAPPRLAWIREPDFEAYKDVVDEYYAFTDEQVGRVLERVDESWTVFVVSDHGFRIGDSRPKSTETVDMQGAHLDHEPEGVFLACGPGIRTQGTIEGASVLDVTPTLLHALGLEVASDMAGRVLTAAFEPAYLEQHPIRYKDTYETGARQSPDPSPAGAGTFGDAEAMASLEALGYVEPASAGDDEVTSPEQRNNLGNIYLQNGEVEKALAQYRKVLESSPHDGEALTNIARTHLARGQTDEALRRLMEALQYNPNHAPALLMAADLRASRNELPAAEAMYRQALAINPRLPGPYVSLGDVLQRQQKYEPAREAFQQAVELDPNLSAAHYNLGVVHMQLGNSELAIAAYEKSLELTPGNPMALNNLGHIYHQLGDTEKALQQFEAAAESVPGHLESRFNIGSILLDLGRAEEAVPWLRQATSLQPDLEVAQLRYAQALLESGQQEESRRHYEMLVRTFPMSGVPCLQLARISLRESKPEEALEWLRHGYLRAGPAAEPVIRQDPAFASLDLEQIFRTGN